MGDRGFAVGLVEPIVHRAPQEFIALGGEGGRDHAGVCGILHSIEMQDLMRQPDPGLVGLDFLAGHEKHKMQGRRNFAAEKCLIRPRRSETPEGSRGSIVGMPFEVGAESVELIGVQRAAGQRIEAVEDAETQGHAATQAPRAGNVAFDLPRKVKGRGLAIVEKSVGGLFDH